MVFGSSQVHTDQVYLYRVFQHHFSIDRSLLATETDQRKIEEENLKFIVIPQGLPCSDIPMPVYVYLRIAE